MRHIAIYLAALILMVSACTRPPKPAAPVSAAEQPTIEKMKKQADRLLARMADESYEVREEASRRLQQLLSNTRKWPQLCEYLGTRYENENDDEVKDRIGRALDSCILKHADFKKLFEVHGPGYITASTMHPATGVFISAHTTHDLKENTIALWNLPKGEITRKLSHREEYIETIACSPDGRLIASGTNNKTVRIWDAAKGECLHTLKGHEKGILSIAFSPDGRLLASGDAKGVVRIWNAASGDCVHTLPGHENTVHLIAFSPDRQKLATADRDGRVCLWAADTGKLINAYTADKINALAFSPDDTMLAAGGADERFVAKDDDFDEFELCSEGRIFVLDTDKGTCFRTLKTPASVVYQVRFKPKSNRLLWSDRGESIRTWDIQTGKRLKPLTEPYQQVAAFAFGPCGAFLTSVGLGWNVRLWNPFTGKCLKVLHKASDVPNSLLLTRDGRYAVCHRETAITILGLAAEK